MPKYVSTMYILTMDNIQEKLVTCCQAAMTYTAQLRDENEIQSSLAQQLNLWSTPHQRGGKQISDNQMPRGKIMGERGGSIGFCLKFCSKS